jgi:hypothetical protein
VVLIVASVLLAGCPLGEAGTTVAREVHVNPGFIEDLVRSTGRSADDVVVPQSTLDDLARRADVGADQVATSAQRASEPPVITSTAETLDEQFGQFGEDVAKEAALELTCDYLETGQQISGARIQSALGEAVGSATSSKARQVGQAINTLATDLQAALDSDDPERRASVVLMCFYVGQATG